MPMEMEKPTFETHPFSYTSSISNESNEVKPMNGMEESISFGRFTSESLNWEKWSTFNSNRYVEEAEKYSKPGSVMQKKAFLEAHFKKMTSLKDEPSTTPSPDHDSDDYISIQQSPSKNLSTEPTIKDQEWIDKEDFGDKSSNEQVELSGIDAVGSDQLPDVGPVAETVNGFTNEQEFDSQRSSVNQENSAPESIKRTPLSSYIPAVEAGSSLISSTSQEDSGVQSPSAAASHLAAHPVKEMKKRRSPLYKIINAKLLKKITGSSKPSKNSRLKTSVKEKPKSKLFHIFLCGSNPPSN